MGSLIGHVIPGFGFFLIGIWHLLNHIKLHALHPKSYTSLLWFPTQKSRYAELFFIMGGTLASISMELFIGPSKHQPLDSDGTIPSYHLHNFEHANISLTFFVYAVFSIIFDKINIPSTTAKYGLTQFLATVAFGQELLLFHLHSTDHTGLEGQYHWLLQIVIFACLATTLLSIPFPNSFLNSFVRSYSIMFQGIWMMVIGIMLWTPGFIPKGCFLNYEDGHKVARCHNNEALERAKSLVNIQFSWYLVGITVFTISLYLLLVKNFRENVEYLSLINKFEDEDFEDVEVQKRKLGSQGEPKMFLEMGKQENN
ncbi:uncharacterized protein LOC107797736 [Nicotiana tabacum]|uniref:Transmembrane protein 45A n=2 Tax=Nicotiana TaxID=4085 RepID=A0A1S4AHL6_TOBAC|nr:PREDICTED: transmembrane protein 45A-like [Nicotiana sylvestris]XP_016476146.1 PREDICTED: transmembrane protein 45A-like [Nicotiana tabacum]